MPSQTVVKRLDQLEKAVQSVGNVDARLSTVESQFLQLHRETRDEISAVRRNLATTRADLEAVIEAAIAPLATKEELRAAVALLATKEELKAAIAPLATKEELKAAIAPLTTRSEMLILHEDLVERLKTLGELWRTPPRKKRR